MFVWIAVTIWIFTHILGMFAVAAKIIEETKRMTDG